MRVKDNRTQVHFWCPGCNRVHGIDPTKWTWNGDVDKPTFNPSVLVYPHPRLDGDGNRVMSPTCHSFVRDGQIHFLTDSEHALAGQTADIPEWPYQ